MMQNMTPTSLTPATQPSAGLSKKVFLVVVVVGLLVFGKWLHMQGFFAAFLQRVESLGSWGVMLFIAVYVLATVLFIPGAVLTLGAGALFGVVWGSVYVSVGSTIGATAAFLVGRYLARDAISKRIEGNPRFAAIDSAVAREGWKIVGLTRLSPVFPFTLLNYAFGLTRVKLSHYVLASWIGMMPGTVMYVYLGSLAKEATGPGSRTAAEWTLYGIGLLATLVVTIFIARIAKKSLSQSIHSSVAPPTP